MKKIFFIAAIALATLNSCTKEALNSTENEIVASNESSANRAYKWVDTNETFAVHWWGWNECTGEMVEFIGTGHLRVQGSVTKNGFNFTMHYNAANIKGVGQTSGTIYRTTDSFNYHHKGNFTNGQLVYQQTGIIKYTSAGNEPNLFSEDNWHLTINANGEVTSFSTTGGRIYSCR
jgi:hypothetical protein